MSHPFLRSETFLDHPDAYSEYSLFVRRRNMPHTMILMFHKHRTAVLLALLALLAALSGVEIPTSPLLPGGSSTATIEDWRSFLVRGLGLDLLPRHCNGVTSALACIAVITAASFLVYPLYLWTTGKHLRATSGAQQQRRHRLSMFAAGLISVGFPSAISWGVAVWGVDRFRWGVYSGLAVGLQGAAMLLKSWSFFQVSCTTNSARGARGSTEEGSGIAKDAQSTTPVNRGGLEDEIQSLRGCHQRPPSIPDAADVDRDSVSKIEGRKDAPDLPTASVRSSSPGGTVRVRSEPPSISGLSVTAPHRGSFVEFSTFLLLTPCLEYKPDLLKRNSQLAPDVLSALSELFHAALTFLAAHAYAVIILAPTFRVMMISFGTLSSSWVEFDEAMSGLHHANGGTSGGGGGAGWLANFLCREASGEGSGDVLCVHWRLIVLSIAFGSAMFVSSPAMHFLCFYAFFHCFCLGSARLSGYPDRHFYGPWWLVVDDPRDHFRMWSRLVHRWLKTCVYNPMIAAGVAATAARSGVRERPKSSPVGGAAGIGPPERSPGVTRVLEDGKLRGHGILDLGGSAGAGSSSVDENPRDKGIADGSCPKWWVAMTIMTVFTFSGALHEAVGYVMMRRTIYPVSSFFLVLGAGLAPFWDALFPVIEVPSGKESSLSRSPERHENDSGVGKGGGEQEHCPSKGKDGGDAGAALAKDEAAVAGEGSGRVEERRRTKEPPRVMGRSRGWGAICFIAVSKPPSTLFFDYMVWRWWNWSCGE